MNQSSVPRVFVGTMYAGEGDYDEMCAAVSKQVGVSVQHHTIANLPEKEAHNRLWHAWRAVQNDGFNMFVKVDADTVLAHEEVLLEFWNLMSSNPRITGIQAPLLDYFTDGYINGLNCFSPKVRFLDSAHDLFCDRQVDVDHDIVVKASGVQEKLRPAGYHCFKSTNIQAFHYGVHRALKNQATTLNCLRSAWARHHDKTRAYALLGVQHASLFTNGGFNYDDERFKLTFNAVDQKFDELVNSL